MNTQINSMGLTSLTVVMHCDYHYNVNTLIGVATAEVLHLEALAAEYSALVAQECSIVKRQTAYVSTELLNQADKERDNALGVIFNLITAHLTNTIEAKRSAALYLDAKVAPYRKIRYHEKRTETREVDGLMAVLTTEEAMAHITTLGLTQELEQLNLKNAVMGQILDQKLLEEVERTPQTSISTDELRSQVDAKYAEIVKTVNAYAIVQPSTEIEKFITQVNALITLTKRAAASLGKDTTEEDPETADAVDSSEQTEDTGSV